MLRSLASISVKKYRQKFNTKLTRVWSKSKQTPSINRDTDTDANVVDEADATTLAGVITLQSHSNNTIDSEPTLLAALADERPLTPASARARYIDGIGGEVKVERKKGYIMRVKAYDDQGNWIWLMALFDTGASSSFITHWGKLRITQSKLQTKEDQIPTEFQTDYSSPMFKGTYKPSHFFKPTVRNEEIQLGNTPITLFLLPNIVSEDSDIQAEQVDIDPSDFKQEDLDIIFGDDFIDRHDPGLLQRVRNSPESITTTWLFAPTLINPRRKKQRKDDEAKSQEQTQRDHEEAAGYKKIREHQQYNDTNAESQGQANGEGTDDNYTDSPRGEAPQSHIHNQEQSQTELVHWRDNFSTRTDSSTSGNTLFSRRSDTSASTATTRSAGSSQRWRFPGGASRHSSRSNSGLTELEGHHVNANGNQQIVTKRFGPRPKHPKLD